MKRFIIPLFLLCASAFGQQAARVDIPLLTSGPSVAVPGGALPQVLWTANSTVFLCTHPSATLAACQANLIQTFSDSTEATTCPSATQLVQLPGNTCTAATGVTANIGAWISVGTFDYWLISSYGTFGPFTYYVPTANGCPTTGCTFTGPIAAPTLNFTQVYAPITAPVIVSVTSGGSVDVGNHWYVVTFTVPMPPSPSNVTTGETDFSPQSAEATTTGGTQTVNLTIPVGPSGVTGRNIYRVDNAPVAFPYYRLVGTVANNTTTSFADAVSYASLPSLPNGIQNMPNSTGGWLQVNGLDVGLLTVSDTFFGFCSGGFSRSALDGASFDNTYIGWGAGCEAARSYNNVAVGVNAMPAPVQGDDNVAVGVHAAQTLYAGQNNTALGFAAGYSVGNGNHNVAVGVQACYLCAGGYNTTIGNYAFNNNALGNNNIGIGFYAGYNDNLASGDFFVNSFSKADLTHDVNESIIYGHMDNNPANQTLQFNAGAGSKFWTGTDWGNVSMGILTAKYGLVLPASGFVDALGNAGFTSVQGINYVLVGGGTNGLRMQPNGTGADFRNAANTDWGAFTIGRMTYQYQLLAPGGTQIADVSGNVTPGGGTNIVYRCLTAGASTQAGVLTTVAADCGTSTDTGLRVK